MKISQRAYFSLASQTVTAAEITALLGIEPDAISVRGSKRTAPHVVPLEHSWELHCPDHGLPLDDQTDILIARVTPIHDRLRELVTTRDVGAGLIFVRGFNATSGEDEQLADIVTDEGRVLERIPGQHQLLGWTLSPTVITFLASINVHIVADEYG